MDVVLCLGFDLFFKPKLSEAARAAGVTLHHASPAQAVDAAQGAARVVADVSSPGVEDALRAVRAAFPAMPILACYPHVEEHRAQAVRAMGGVAMTRGAFAADMARALGGGK